MSTETTHPTATAQQSDGFASRYSPEKHVVVERAAVEEFEHLHDGDGQPKGRVVIDASRELRAWRSGPDLFIGEYASDGKGGQVPGPCIGLPMMQAAELVQALLRIIKAN